MTTWLADDDTITANVFKDSNEPCGTTAPMPSYLDASNDSRAHERTQTGVPSQRQPGQ